MDLNQKLDTLELKVKQLIRYNQKLRHEVDDLSKKNQKFQNSLAKERANSRKLTAQLAEEKGVTQRDYKAEVQSAKQLHQQLEQYIKDIDQCIEWLQYN